MKRQRGASAVEYAIILSLIGVVILLAVAVLGSNSKANFECAGNAYGGTVCAEAGGEDGDQDDCSSQNKDPGKGCYEENK